MTIEASATKLLGVDPITWVISYRVLPCFVCKEEQATHRLTLQTPGGVMVRPCVGNKCLTMAPDRMIQAMTDGR